MKKIIGVFKPFSLKQNLYVFEDGNKIYSVSVPLAEVTDTVFALSKEYDIDRVDLSGPKQFVRGLKNNFEKKELEQYSKSSITFNII